jgi:hypothetical protein
MSDAGRAAVERYFTEKGEITLSGGGTENSEIVQGMLDGIAWKTIIVV